MPISLLFKRCIRDEISDYLRVILRKENNYSPGGSDNGSIEIPVIGYPLFFIPWAVCSFAPVSVSSTPGISLVLAYLCPYLYYYGLRVRSAAKIDLIEIRA
jgi:hypothetical protein